MVRIKIIIFIVIYQANQLESTIRTQVLAILATVQVAGVGDGNIFSYRNHYVEKIDLCDRPRLILLLFDIPWCKFLALFLHSFPFYCCGPLARSELNYG